MPAKKNPTKWFSKLSLYRFFKCLYFPVSLFFYVKLKIIFFLTVMNIPRSFWNSSSTSSVN